MYICQDTNWNGSKNKFWGYERVSDIQVVVKWGRIGTKGQSKSYTFGDKWSTDGFINKKVGEKMRKGYVKIDDATYDILHAQAAALGTRHKISDQRWVEVTSRSDGSVIYKDVPTKKLANPNVSAALRIKVEMKGKKSEKPRNYALLITSDEVFDLQNARLISAEDHPDLQKVMLALSEGIVE